MTRLEKIKEIPLANFCIERLGYRPNRARDSRLWRSLESPGGHKIVSKSVPNRNGHYMFFPAGTMEKGGTLVDLLIKFHGYTIARILEEFGSQNLSSIPRKNFAEFTAKSPEKIVREEHKKFLKKCAKNSEKNYLERRGIGKKVQDFFGIKATKNETFFPLVFLEQDRLKVATAIRYVLDDFGRSKRYFLGGLQKRGSFVLLKRHERSLEEYEYLNIFESPIDALAYKELFFDRRDAIFLSFCGGFGDSFLENLKRFLRKFGIKEIRACLDNDSSGWFCYRKLLDSLTGFRVVADFPRRKDWAEELISQGSKEKNKQTNE